MVARALAHLSRLLLLLAVTVSLTATGFAHKSPNAQDQALAFALATGAGADDLCGDMPGGSPRAGHCIACQITGSANLPPLTRLLIDADLAFVASVITSRETRALARVLDPGHSPQGPPTA
jgi:hypothetical protein